MKFFRGSAMTTIVIMVLVLIIVGGGTWYYFSRTKNQATDDQFKDQKTFTNSVGGYSFEYSSVWTAAVNKYNNKNSLFGVGATSESGQGGIEVNNYTGTLEAYLDYTEKNADVKYVSRENITINGVAGIRTNYEGFPASGHSVLLKNGDQIFNIFINSKEANDIELFNKLVASFKF